MCTLIRALRLLSFCVLCLLSGLSGLCVILPLQSKSARVASTVHSLTVNPPGYFDATQELRATSVFEKRGSRRGAKPGHRHVAQKHKSRKLPRLTWQTWILRHSPKWQTWSMTTSNRPGISRPTENICTRFSVCKRGDSATVGVHVFHCKLLVFQCETWRLRNSQRPRFSRHNLLFFTVKPGDKKWIHYQGTTE